MQNAAVERLAKIISDKQENGSGGRFRPRRPITLHLGLAEGWFSLFLLAAVVYSTIWCVQAVGWVEHLNILSLTTAIGLIIGVVAAKQQRFPRLAVHCVTVVLGILLAFWQTAGAYYDGSTAEFVKEIREWYTIVMEGGVGETNAIFLFFIVALGFILAYTSAWLVYRTRAPWLMIVANAVVMLINLSNVELGYAIFLVIFLMAALLLLLRFNLYESVRRWKKQGLRYADDIGWDVMQAGALISIGIIILSWVLPWGYKDPVLEQVWNAESNPAIQVQNIWNRIISVNGGASVPNHGTFSERLTLGGNPNLKHEPVFKIQTEDNSQYLMAVSYDTYKVRDDWSIGPTSGYNVATNQIVPTINLKSRQVKQTVTVVNTPGGSRFLFGAPDIFSASLATTVQQSRTNNQTIAWMMRGRALTTGTTYSVVSNVSAADVDTLRKVLLPVDGVKELSPEGDQPIPPSYYSPALLKTYLALPENIDPRISDLAKKITAGKTTMYDMALALESHMRKNYKYSLDVEPPKNSDRLAWFLFDSGNKGYCNYYASAMAVMARSLGLPARVVAGYTNGELDTKTNLRTVYGTDAHAWTQIYFGGYGWINFEPSESFSTFSRPLPEASGSNSSTSGSGTLNPGDITGNIPIGGRAEEFETAFGGSASEDSGQILRQQLGMTLGGFVLLLIFSGIFFGIWWMRLFRRYDIAARLYGRTGVLASWAGIKPQSSQTPYEYMQIISVAVPKESATIERLGDVYVRDRWANPESEEHPRKNGEIRELPGLWKRLEPRLFIYVLQHPYFLRWLPERVWSFMTSYWRKRRAQRITDDEE